MNNNFHISKKSAPPQETMATERSPIQFVQKELELEAMDNSPTRQQEEEGVLIDKDGDLQTVVFGRIKLNKGISKGNFYTTCIYVVYLGFIIISMSTLEPEYVSQLGVPKETLGRVTAGLYLIDYVIRLVFALAYGLMIDHFGRKLVMMIGFILTSLGYFAIPLLGNEVFPNYFIGKSIFSAGIIGISMLPLQADYVHNSTKGVMTGISFGLGFSGGAASAGVLKLLTWYNFRYQSIYWILSLGILVAGLLLSFGIKGGNKYYRVEKTKEEQEEEGNSVKISKWREVKQAFKEIPWISMSIIFGILGNTDLYVMTTGMIIWIKSLLGVGVDPTQIVTTYQAVFFALSFLMTAVMALNVDKVSHMKLIFPILILSILGFIPIPFIHDAYSKLFYVFTAIEGIALPGIFVFSTYLSIRYNPPEIRGTLSGISNGISFIGAIIVLSLGGFLHDHWRKDASFLIYWILLGSTLILVSILYKFMIYDKAKIKRTLVRASSHLSTRPMTEKSHTNLQ